MLSLYIHIPFCEKKCKYCSFFVYPMQDKKVFDQYVQALKEQIEFWSDNLTSKELKTIYFGGGTPALIGKQRLADLIDFIGEKFDLTYLEELNIELNPNPFSETLSLIDFLNKRYGKKFFRLRFSFGLQTFDDKILKRSQRAYFYNNLIGFLRDLTKHKQANNVFNFDFIAFGSKRRDYKYQFFEKFVNSLFADSFSIYTLELFPGSLWHDVQEIDLSDGKIYEEFQYLKSVVKKAGYKRYEISNFALAGRESIHNLVYWQMGNYLGLGLSASSFIADKNLIKDWSIVEVNEEDFEAIRWTNTTSWQKFLKGEFIDLEKVTVLDLINYKIEKFFLTLRTVGGVNDISYYISVLVKDWQEKLQQFQAQNLVKYDGQKLALTDKGMDLYHQIVPELLKEI